MGAPRIRSGRTLPAAWYTGSMARSAPEVFEGVGLHTGARCRLEVRPAPAGAGLRFIRGGVVIPATIGSVVATARRTVLGRAGRRVSTVEHLLAALAGLGLWDVELVVAGPEVPILDGSARPFVEALGRFEPSEARPWEIDRTIVVETEGGRAVVEPSRGCQITCAVEFDHPAIGRQAASWDGGRASFVAEVAPARTFGFVVELEALRRRSLIAGGSLGCALVYGDEGPLTPPRFSDEVARHKLLDAVGDLALLGGPLRARVSLERPGHELTTMLVRELRSRQVGADGGGLERRPV